MKMKHVSKVVCTGSIWLFVMVLLTAGSRVSSAKLTSPSSQRISSLTLRDGSTKECGLFHTMGYLCT